MEICAIESDGDHLHLIICYPPALGLSGIVRRLKTRIVPDRLQYAPARGAEAALGQCVLVAELLRGQALVEDEAPVRSFTSRALKLRGYREGEAESAEDAMVLLSEGREQVDLLVSDVLMPSMDGPTFAIKARELRPDLRAIFISGYSEDSFRRSVVGSDFQFVPKPFSLRPQASESGMDARPTAGNRTARTSRTSRLSDSVRLTPSCASPVVLSERSRSTRTNSSESTGAPCSVRGTARRPASKMRRPT